MNVNQLGDLPKIYGTQLFLQDTPEMYRQKLARITLDSMVQFVGLLDAQGTVLEINKVALDAVGIKLSDVEGRPFWTTFWWQVSPQINAMLREYIRRAAAGEFVRWDTPIYGRAGGKETIIIDASLMPVKDELGNVVFIAAEGRDITEKKAYEREIARQREELAKLDQLKTEFFANISHEFRTPLTLMLGPLEDALSEEEGLSASNRERLMLAHRNALRQFKLVNALLDFSRIEADRIEASYEATDLPQLTADLASVWRSAIERAGLRFIIRCAVLSEEPVIDREMWEKIVLNLLSNAFKFTFEGEIEISLEQDGSRVVLVVRDTGVGIPPGELPRLFDRFHRVKGARSRSYEGSGIGLALVRELVRLHGGSIHVESEEGTGSRFIVAIPLGKQHLPPDRVEAPRVLTSTASRAEAYVQEALRWLPETSSDKASEALPQPSAQLHHFERQPPELLLRAATNSCVLLADDNADMRDYIARLLTEAGHDVLAAADGLSALNLARQQKPDLILMDVMMPGLDGFALLREVRADAELRGVPCIMLSARAGEESRIEGMEAGADDYLVKPFSGRELLARVESQLKLAQLRRHATDALTKSETRLRALVRASSDIVYSMSPDWAEMRHLEGREFIADTQEPGRTWIEKYIHPADQPAVMEKIDGAIRARTLFELEHRVRRLDGSLGWTSSRAIPIFDDQGKLVEWIGMASDITERKRLEESLRQADRRKDEFLATLAHELRNPLAPIRNALHLLKGTDVPDGKARAAREIVERQVHHMVRLVDDLMEVSRITLGQINLRLEKVSLREVIADALEAAGPVIEADRHTLSVQLAEEVLFVNGDATRLSQVFQNLLVNAAKYTPPGGRITLRTECVGDEARVSVHDTGIGIAKELQSRVFELFTRVHHEERIKTSGLGIGLALAKQLVERHGGHLDLHSEGAGMGSEFMVCLPLCSSAIRTTQTVAGASVSSASQSGKRVLVVDDNKDAAESLAMVLQIDGSTVWIAENGIQALKDFVQFEPNVVLLDIGLPDLDGYEVARRMRESVRGEAVLLIALTGWGQAEDKRRAMEAGFDEHLTKPVDPEFLRVLLAVERKIPQRGANAPP
jgi:PAS domain S-box-containing protein